LLAASHILRLIVGRVFMCFMFPLKLDSYLDDGPGVWGSGGQSHWAREQSDGSM